MRSWQRWQMCTLRDFGNMNGGILATFFVVITTAEDNVAGCFDPHSILQPRVYLTSSLTERSSPDGRILHTDEPICSAAIPFTASQSPTNAWDTLRLPALYLITRNYHPSRWSCWKVKAALRSTPSFRISRPQALISVSGRL